jgi:hypothetical protein
MKVLRKQKPNLVREEVLTEEPSEISSELKLNVAYNKPNYLIIPIRNLRELLEIQQKYLNSRPINKKVYNDIEKATSKNIGCSFSINDNSIIINYGVMAMRKYDIFTGECIACS